MNRTNHPTALSSSRTKNFPGARTILWTASNERSDFLGREPCHEMKSFYWCFGDIFSCFSLALSLLLFSPVCLSVLFWASPNSGSSPRSNHSKAMSQLTQQDDVPVPATVEENSRDPSAIDEDAALLVRQNLPRNPWNEAQMSSVLFPRLTDGMIL